jgi:predicted RNA-binding protein with RPS1 domain
MRLGSMQIAEVLRPGMVRPFLVDREHQGRLRVVIDQDEWEMLWNRLRTMQEHDVTFPAKVVEASPGGLNLEVVGYNIEGFVPLSHMGALEKLSEEDRDALVGTVINVKLLELDDESERLSMSVRAVESAGMLDNFKIGDVLEGVVSKILAYGAFLDVEGGVQALLHVSHISHDRVFNVEDIMTIGDRLKVRYIASFFSAAWPKYLTPGVEDSYLIQHYKVNDALVVMQHTSARDPLQMAEQVAQGLVVEGETHASGALQRPISYCDIGLFVPMLCLPELFKT